MNSVNATKNKDIHTGIFMFWSGIGSTAVAVISPLVGMRMELINPDSKMGKLNKCYPLMERAIAINVIF